MGRAPMNDSYWRAAVLFQEVVGLPIGERTAALNAGWAFLLPVGQHVGDIQSIEEPPNPIFTNSSFGWKVPQLGWPESAAPRP